MDSGRSVVTSGSMTRLWVSNMTQILFRTAPTAESAALLANALEQAGARVFSITLREFAMAHFSYELWIRTDLDPAWVDSAVKEALNGVRG